MKHTFIVVSTSAGGRDPKKQGNGSKRKNYMPRLPLAGAGSQSFKLYAAVQLHRTPWLSGQTFCGLLYL
jgi:hypothetical protein